MEQVPAILLLEDGTVFKGKSAGKIGTTAGEICFNTGMTGYQEIFTDPSYFGQLLVATNAHIGNYGTKTSDTESSNIKIAGLICKNFTSEYSRQVADESIQDYFEEEALVGISDVDTRAIVRHIRSKGAMNAIISSETQDVQSLKVQLAKVPNMDGLELASKVSTKEAYVVGPDDAKYKIAALDLGIKKNIINCFVARGCQVKVFPAKTNYETLKAWQPDGYFLSNGPGDPAPMTYAVNTNHPVKNLITGSCEITSQNHGFGVSPKAIVANSDKVEITHRNLNDDTIEGIRIKGKNAFSVQYHPEASPGPHDARYLFDTFIDMMEKNK